jgi:REP element-mobilizing transposase RayT
MPHTYVDNVLHCVFSTAERRPFIHLELQPQLWSYMAGIAREHKIKTLLIGGMADHCHALIALPSTVCIADAMRWIKGGSSKWLREKHVRGFGWQEGFAAFGVSASQRDKVLAYIRNQPQHHRKIDFKSELITLLEKHGVEYDDRYLW